MASDGFPRYLYKIVPTAPPEPLPQEYPLSELDQTDGFVHLSTDEQVPNTCDLFFTQTTQLWVLKLEFAPIKADIKWEGGFPHLYANFGAKQVVSVNKFSRSEDQKWSENMKGSTWLE
ncbi:hypothetical protein V2G26_008525 [Clonostachys chloroleuca]|uniref:DUF952 domain-containing protein n=3 Tax=Clonostachys TaxID=110564 RepID=A0A0B7K966_BIOOC|nr:unnamed protein product [Clonostachys rosea f. rosea IK726]CAH0024371.1 unnamed protein product [Clonostachys rhizophaga]